MIEQLAAVGSALTAIKTISEIAKNVNSIELTQKVIELQNSMRELQDVLSEKDKRIQELEVKALSTTRAEEIRADLEWRQDGAFLVRKSEKPDGPGYCPTCWTKNELTHLAPGLALGSFLCPVHETQYFTQEYRDMRSRQAQEFRTVRGRFAAFGDSNWMR